MWFDSHCHLHLCEENSAIADVIDRAARAGVTEMLTVGIDLTSSRRALEIASNTGMRAAVGVHPNSSIEWDEETAAAIEDLLQDERVTAVGETGLDFYRDAAPADVQKRAFLDHIELSKTYDKTMVIHTRDSLDEALEVLSEVGPPSRFVFHCWSGDLKQVDTAIELGAHISFAGNVSFKSAEDLRDAARVVPADRLLVETDSPFLSPVPHRGKPNEPSLVTFVGVAVATARVETVDAIAEHTTRNARNLFS